MIVIDGVFSMDGDIAPIEKLLHIAEQYDALLMVDDAHGFGVLGEQGHGILEQAGVTRTNHWMSVRRKRLASVA